MRLGFTGAATYNERNFSEHGCELTITAVPSPTTENRFDPDPVSPPFWLPPSGNQVRWLRINSISCLPETGNDERFHIAVDPLSRAPIRAIGLNGLPARGGGFGHGGPLHGVCQLVLICRFLCKGRIGRSLAAMATTRPRSMPRRCR